MDQPYKTVRSEVEVAFGGVSPGSPPSVTVVYDTVGRGNVARRMVRQLAVPDAPLFHRLTADVVGGDKIEAVILTHWYDTGSVTVLEDFKKIASASRIAETTHVAANGNTGSVRNGITQMDAASVQPAKDKVGKQ